MLTILGRASRYCDGIARRGFLRIGGFTMGSTAAVGLPGLMRAQAATPNANAGSGKAIINIFLGGGPIRTCGRSKLKPPARSVVSSRRSTPQCQAFRSANVFRNWPPSWIGLS
ncbi:MAG UNVERIFIED_CONTAM: hypothetical protein LVR18_23830 [Planctomycetaceae bacterium]